MSDQQSPRPSVRRGLDQMPPPASTTPVAAESNEGSVSEPASHDQAATHLEGSSPGRRGLDAGSSQLPHEERSQAARPSSAVPAVETVSGQMRPRGLWQRLGIVAILALGAAGLVIAARILVAFPSVQQFLVSYPGQIKLPDDAPVGFPAWLAWQHFLNAFFLVLMIKTGWQVRTQRRPPAYWTRDNTRFPKTKNPPRKISLTLWLHLSLDALWLVNGIASVILLFATGQWLRVVPTSFAVVPNALSAALQYASLHWPTEDGWNNYNSLQVLAYFVTIFVAAPLAAITGLRMSGAWPTTFPKLNRLYPVELARAIHFPVMVYFVLFVITHVTLVLATGAIRNLNHMYGGQDAVNWTGTIIFAVSLIVMAAAWMAAKPIVVTPIAKLFGKVGR